MRSAPVGVRTGLAHTAVSGVHDAGADGTVAVAVLDRATGELAGNPDGRTGLYSASLVKLVVAIDVLQRRHAGLPLGEVDLELVRRALSLSDDDAMNALWDRYDGVGAVTRLAVQLRLTELRPPAEPGQWGQTVLSARDMVLLLDHVLTGMVPEDRDLILNALDTAPAIAAGGFDQAFGLEDPEVGRPSATKAGWMCCQDGLVSMHSAGVVGPERRFVVAVLSSRSSGAGYAEAREDVSEVAAEVLRELL